MFCSTCGNKLEEQSNFCNSCGTAKQATQSLSSHISVAEEDHSNENTYHIEHHPNEKDNIEYNDTVSLFGTRHQQSTDGNNYRDQEFHGQYARQGTEKIESIDNRMYYSPETEYEPSETQHKKSKAGVIFFVASLMAALLIIGFVLWFIAPNSDSASDNISTTTAEYNVIFYLNDGTREVFDELMAVPGGEIISPPSEPYREGYTFLYWTSDRRGNHRFDFDTPLRGDISLFAKWEEGSILAEADLDDSEAADTEDEDAVIDEADEQEDEQEEDAIEDEEDQENETTPDPTIVFDTHSIDNIISNRTNPSNVAAAILDLNEFELHRTANRNTLFVASGFYAPIYLVAIYNDHRSRQQADSMMQTMDNGIANTLIDDNDGFSGVNSTLRELGFAETRFARHFGDTVASQRGEENFTTAYEAAWILREIYEIGGHLEMDFDVTRDNIVLPRGGTFYTHRGTGIGTEFNLFAVVVTPAVNYVVVILTDGLERADATALISELLADIQDQMRQIYE